MNDLSTLTMAEVLIVKSFLQGGHAIPAEAVLKIWCLILFLCDRRHEHLVRPLCGKNQALSLKLVF